MEMALQLINLNFYNDLNTDFLELHQQGQIAQPCVL